MSTPPPEMPPARPRLADVFAWLRAPRFTARRERIDALALTHLGTLLAASILAMIVALPMIGAVVSGAMGEVPDNVLDEIDPVQLLISAVVFAPIIEELAFRSWLGGPRAVLIGLPVLAGVLALLSAVNAGAPEFPLLVGAAVLGVLFGQLAIRVFKSDPAAVAALRARAFPAILWISVVMFGVMHIANFEGGLSHPVLLLAVLPQTVIGAVLAYVRMRYGLVAAIGWHGAYNGVLIGLSLWASGAVEAAEAAGRLLGL